jgi:hypothetical protein
MQNMRFGDKKASAEDAKDMTATLVNGLNDE